MNKGQEDLNTMTRADAFLEITHLRARVRELEGVLTGARLQIEYLHEKFRETGSGNAVLAGIKAALGRSI